MGVGGGAARGNVIYFMKHGVRNSGRASSCRMACRGEYAVVRSSSFGRDAFHVCKTGAILMDKEW
jgi:hypothetical protein